MSAFNRTAATHTTAALNPRRVALFGALAVAATMCLPWGTASAAIVPTVPLGTSANYSVLGASTVTNTGPSVLNRSLGLYSGTSITGFDTAVPGDGRVIAPGTIDQTNAAAQLAQADLTAAYIYAANQPSDRILQGSDLTNQVLLAGVWGDGSTLLLSGPGPVTLDGEGNYDSVFIIKTPALTTMSGSSVVLTNGAQACNVFWQIGSSATLGSGSTFAGNILALTSISLDDSVTVNGRALARNGAVTLINDVFNASPCQTGLVNPTAATTVPADSATTTPVDATAVTEAGTDNTTTGITTVGTGSTTVRNVPGNDLTLRLPETGRPVGPPVALAVTFLALGVLAMWFGRRKLATHGG